jgi:hypothetical protein
MTLYPVAVVAIPLALVCLFLDRKYLLAGTVAFAVMASVRVADIPGLTNVKAHQIWGGLFILSGIFSSLRGKNVRISTSSPHVLAALFLVTCVASFVATSVLEGEVRVFSEITRGAWGERIANPEPLRFSTFNLTQLAYPVFGLLLFYSVSRYITSVGEVAVVLRTIVWSALVVAVSQVAYGVLFTIGAGSTATALLTNFTGDIGFSAPISIGGVADLYRSYSLAGEPGDTGQMYVLALSVIAPFALLKNSRYSVFRYPGRLSTLFLFLIVLNGSTTAFLGLFILFATSIITLLSISSVKFVSTRNNLLKVSAFVLVSAFVVFLAYQLVPQRWGIGYHLGKLLGYSGGDLTIRWKVVNYTIYNVFYSSPFIGVGYGSHLSSVFGPWLLANTGIVGFVIFYLLVYRCFASPLKWLSIDGGGRWPLIPVAVSLSVATYFILIIAGKSAGAFGQGSTWLILGVGASFYHMKV